MGYMGVTDLDRDRINQEWWRNTFPVVLQQNHFALAGQDPAIHE
jgi:hypothetical protein